jgi:hypothetical protein
MTEPHPPRPGRQPYPGGDPHGPAPDRLTWAQRRRERIIAEIQRNRRGEYTVPTWVLTVALVAIVGAWTAFVIFA